MDKLQYKDYSSPREESHPQQEKTLVEQKKQHFDETSINHEQIIAASRQVFDSMVTRDYLHELNSCEILPMEKSN